jgi:hypothetical protein
MKANLLFADRDLELAAEPPSQADELVADLGLDVLFDTMAGGDKAARAIAATVLLHPLTDPATVVRRQQVLADCLARPQLATELHSLARDTIDGAQGIDRWFFAPRPKPLLSRAVKVLALLLDRLKQLRAFALAHHDEVNSAALQTLFARVTEELGDDYLAEVQERIRQLSTPVGMLISARLGNQQQSVDLALRELAEKRRALVRRPVIKKPAYSYTIPDRDEGSMQALSDLEDRVTNAVANAAMQSADHVLAFFTALRDELTFYLSAMRLHEALERLCVQTCTPTVTTGQGVEHVARALVDPGLALSSSVAPVGNDLDAPTQPLVVITGANRGGKSTFLRAVGIASLMAGAGLFVAAEHYVSSLHSAVFCHYRREEDVELRSGKLDEELRRMQAIAAQVEPGALLLCNESFAATNEAEGSELARQIVTALCELGVTVVFVTHLHDFAYSVSATGTPPAVFMRAERGVDGQRPFRLTPGEPLATSYGSDLFAQVFGAPVGSHDVPSSRAETVR